jgi:UDP:flavonoid glycosyltransferase YjiC (YdhE family)
MGPDIDLGKETAAIRDRAGNPVVGLVRGMRFAFKVLEGSHEDILNACRGADLVVSPANSAAGKNEAELLGVPSVSVDFMPWSIPMDDPERPFYKRTTYGAIDWAVSMITTRPLNRLRREQGLPRVGPEGFRSTQLNLIPISPKVFSPNPHWGPGRHCVVGYWFVEESSDWQPPTELLAFLEDGDPPLLISLGAMSFGGGEALETASLLVEAVQAAGIRAVMQGWDDAREQLSLPPGIHAAEALPHSWLLPKVAALVHHGGFGTTAAGLRAGLPQLAIPHLIDQFYWGQRVHELGVGTAPMARSKLESNKLASALEQVTGDNSIRAVALSLGELIRAEDGLANAVELIEAQFG